MRIQCSRYSDFDYKIIREATKQGLPLTGGTALEIWASYFGRTDVRKRSDNDLDFMASNLLDYQSFADWCVENVDSSKVSVDVYLFKSQDYTDYIRTVDDVLVMSLPFILFTKLVRRTDRDIQDIKWVLSLNQLSDETLSKELSDIGLTEQEITILNNLL